MNNWSLVRRLTRQRIAARYRGSLLGLAWAVLVPLAMVLLLALVFGEVLAVRWQVGDTEAYAAVLFSGLVLHFFVAECIGHAPNLVLDHAHYVKSTRFPVAVLPYPLVLDAGFHLLAGLVVLLLLTVASGFALGWRLLALPLVLLPLVPLGLGLGWLLAAFTVYVRDLQQVVGFGTTGMLLLSPVLYPLSSVPENFRVLYWLNPLTLPVENLRSLVFYQAIPGWLELTLPLLASVLLALCGRALFNRLQPGFYDVL